MKLSEIIELYPDASCIFNARKKVYTDTIEAEDIFYIMYVLRKYNVQETIEFNSNGHNGVAITFDTTVLKYNFEGVYDALNNWGQHLNALSVLLFYFSKGSLLFPYVNDNYGYRYKDLPIEHPDAFERFEYGEGGG